MTTFKEFSSIEKIDFFNMSVNDWSSPESSNQVRSDLKFLKLPTNLEIPPFLNQSMNNRPELTECLAFPEGKNLMNKKDAKITITPINRSIIRIIIIGLGINWFIIGPNWRQIKNSSKDDI